MTARLLTAASLTPLASSLLAIALAFLVGGIFLEPRGKDAIDAYRILFERGLGNSDGLTETFKQMAPLLIVSGGLLIALRAGVWNIGIDGQFMVGALTGGSRRGGAGRGRPARGRCCSAARSRGLPAGWPGRSCRRCCGFAGD